MKEKESLSLRFFYRTFLGRCILKVISHRIFSKWIGCFLSSRFSKFLIPNFIRKNNIKLEELETTSFSSFNDCFTRKILPEFRPIDSSSKHLISPCDGYLSVYKIQDGLVLSIKHSKYTVESLLKNSLLAKRYQNGVCVVMRLCVDNYHRYCYVDDGIKGKNIYIPGILHTVRPIAFERYSVFTENAREYTVLNTKNFKQVVQMEVGALLVGKIKNHDGVCEFKKGQEKGMFLFGGSTIILLLEPDTVLINEEFYKKTEKGEEVLVKMGESIGIQK